MSFRILNLAQPLLQPGDIVWFRGNWPVEWRGKIFRISDALPTIRDRDEGIIGHTDEVTVDPEDIGLNPDRKPFLYQIRIGISDFLGRTYVRWPSNDFTMQLQDPDFSIAPADVSANQQQLIGFIDHTVTKKENPTFLDPAPSLRFEFIWVQDQLPSFLFRGDSGSVAEEIFSKVNVRYMTNICGIAEVDDPQLVSDITSGQLLVTQALHYSEVGRRGL